jgi:hypothetical protein
MEMLLAATLAYLPPAQYDHAYWGVFEVVRVIDMAAAKIVCPEGRRPVGCARWSPPNKCTVYILPDEALRKLGFNPDYALKHEIGHCNGWAGNHPGALTEKEYVNAASR